MTLDISGIKRQAEKDARAFSGNIDTLEINLQNILSFHETQVSAKSELKTNKIKDLESDLQIQEDRIKALNAKKEDKQKEIETKKNEIIQKTSNINQQKHSKLLIGSFVTGLISLGIFLWLFYSSALYSMYIRDIEAEITQQAQTNRTGAGFREATTLKQIYVSIISLDALRQVLSQPDQSDLIIGFLFLLVSPAPFFAASLLIHIFKERDWLRYVWIVYGVTLIFDVVIAFHIIRNIQDAKINKGITTSDTFWGIDTWVNFLIILLTGFIGYIMLGFIYDYFITIYDKESAIRREKNKNDNEIRLLSNSITEIDQQLFQSENKKTEIKNNIDRLKANVSVDEKLVIQEVTTYILGWLLFIYSDEHKKSSPNEDVSNLAQECKKLKDKFLELIKKEYSHSTQ